MSDEVKPNPDAEPEEPDDGFHDPDALTAELVAFLDGELERPQSEAVGTKISLDSNVRAEADALKKTWDLLDHLPRPEPSQSFTERTLSRIVPVEGSSLSGSKTNVSPQRSSTSASVVAPVKKPRRLVRLGGWAIAIVLAALGGYFIRAEIIRQLRHIDRQEQDASILSERRLLQNLHSYRYVDDLALLKALDDPDLFGQEQALPDAEGVK